MLIKLKNGTWQDMSNVVGLTVALIVGTLSWRELPYEILLFDKGWVYRTRAEAEAALPAVAAEMGVEYEL